MADGWKHSTVCPGKPFRKRNQCFRKKDKSIHKIILVIQMVRHSQKMISQMSSSVLLNIVMRCALLARTSKHFHQME